MKPSEALIPPGKTKVSGPSTTEKDIFTYNALGEVKTKQDRIGNVHTQTGLEKQKRGYAGLT